MNDPHGMFELHGIHTSYSISCQVVTAAAAAAAAGWVNNPHGMLTKSGLLIVSKTMSGLILSLLAMCLRLLPAAQ
jgi:hypothetical protein